MLLKTYAATAFLVEGIVIVTGLFFQEVVTDFAWLEAVGWPRAVIVVIAGFLVGIAGVLAYDLWSYLGIHKDSLRRQLVRLVAPNILYGLLGTGLSLSLLPIETGFIRRFISLNAVLQVVFLAVLIGLAPMGLARVRRDAERSPVQFSRRAGIQCILLGSTAWVWSFLFLNSP